MLAHDPRKSDDRSERIETSNIALIDAQKRTERGEEVDWKGVASLADHCDNVSGSYADRSASRFSLRKLFGRR